MDANDIIEAFGGGTALAGELHVVPSAVSMWRTNGIPAARCLELAALATSKRIPGITLEVLMRSTPARRVVS